MKIDHETQLLSFLKTLSKDIKDEEVLKLIEQIVDIERIQTFSKKMLLLQWFFFESPKYYKSDSQMYKNALDADLKDGLIQRLSIELNIGLLKDDWGKDNARTEMGKLAKDGILIRKDIKNYKITELGRECAKLIYFKILESLIGIQNLWKIIKSDLTKQNLLNIAPRMTIEELINWFIIKKVDNQYIFHKGFTELIDFLKNHPELYPRQFEIIRDNLVAWIRNSLISELDKKHARFTISNKDIHYYKDKLKEIDWIYNIKCQYNRRDIDLFKWAISNEFNFTTSKEDGILNKFLNRFIILKAPAGYGKTILLNQLSLKLLEASNLEEHKRIPLYLSLKRFQVRDGKLCYADIVLLDTKSLDNEEIETNKLELIFLKLISCSLSNYKTNDYMLKIFFANLMKNRILLILDGWDELTIEIQILLSRFLKSIETKNFLQNNLKILISSRYIETYLNSIILNSLDPAKKQEFSINVKLPEEENIYDYLTLVSSKIKTKEQVFKLKSKFHGSLTPLDIFLLGIFPLVDLPQYRTQLYERWIYYQVLTDVLDSEEFSKIQSDEDIRVKLESIKLSRELDDRTFYLAQLIDGNVKGDDDFNYSLLKILPRISYSLVYPNLVKPIKYLDAIMSNPLLKRFISPYYKEFQRYAKLIDPHFYSYFIAQYTFSQFLSDYAIKPVPYSNVEDFLMDLYKMNANSPIMKKLGITTPRQFPNYLYLQSGVILPSLQLPYDYGPSSWPLSSVSLRYGIYILKSFQSEFKKAINTKDSVRKTKLLNLFEVFVTKRPTKTFGGYTDEISHDPEVGEPIVNYTPLNYFTLVVQLLNLDNYVRKTGIEINYDKSQRKQYYMNQSFDFTRNNSIFRNSKSTFWRKDDLKNVIIRIFEEDNMYLIPWFSRIYPFFKKEFEVSIDNNLIIEKFKISSDNYISSSLLQILIVNNPERALQESNLFLNNEDYSKCLELLVFTFIEHLSSNSLLTKEEFRIWITLYHHKSTSITFKYKLIRYLYNIILSPEQTVSVRKIYNNEVRDKINQENTDYYDSIEEDPKEFLYIFNCLLLLNHEKLLGNTDPDVYFTGRYDLLIEFALHKRRYHYFQLIIDSRFYTKKKLSQLIKSLGFCYNFSYNHDVFQNLWYDRPYFRNIQKFLEKTHSFLIQVQCEWWEENKPKNHRELKKMLESIFTFYEKYKGTWNHYTQIGESHALHEKEEIQPEIIQIHKLLDYVITDCPQLRERFVDDFFKFVDINILNKLEQEDRDDFFHSFRSELPLFVRSTFEKLQDIDSYKRFAWIKRLSEVRIELKEYKHLINEKDDFSDMYDDIWKNYGKRWIGDKRFVFPKGVSEYRKEFQKKKFHDEFVYLLPFEMLIENIKRELNWKSLREYKKRFEILKEGDELNEEGKEFLNYFYIFVEKLTELAHFPVFSEKAIKFFKSLWEKYYPLWERIKSYHPYTPYFNMTFVLKDILKYLSSTNFLYREEKKPSKSYSHKREKEKSKKVREEEILEILQIKNLKNDKAKEILDKLIPSTYIDDYGIDFRRKIHEGNRKYQKDIFWLLISLIYNKKDSKEVDIDFDDLENDDLSKLDKYYYQSYNESEYYLKRLIYDGIIQNNLNNWLKKKPEDIPLEWFKRLINPMIIKQIFLPNHVEFIPAHLRGHGKRHAWKFLLLPDLANKVEQYFGTYRDDFPFSEYEKSYITEDDDYSGYFSGIS